MTKLTAGTPVIGAYGSYTAEQLATLETMKDRSYTLGIARAEFMNTILNPDGSTSGDIEAMVEAARAQLAGILAGELTDPATLAKAKIAAEFVKEVVDHVKQNRFLFVVNTDNLPVVYFQTAVDGNPDLPMAVAEHPDPAAYAAHAAEVEASIAETIAAAKRTAEAKRAAESAPAPAA
jgi:hypothetical protein